MIAAATACVVAFSSTNRAIVSSGLRHVSHRCFDVRELHVCVHGSRRVAGH
jgi:hypothetical protein